VIEKRKNSESDEPTLLDLMIDSHDNENMTETELIQNFFLFFLAGHKTTSGTLSLVLDIFASHPEIQRKCREEVDNVLPGQNPDYDSIKNLKYLDNVIHETMRIRGVVNGLGRVAKQDCTLAGYHIPKGTFLLIAMSNLHNDPDVWDNPQEFIPERWDSPKVQKNVLMPFGLGERICLGMTFANLEMRLCLVKLLQRYEFFVKNTKTFTHSYYHFTSSTWIQNRI